ncbi:accessory gland protein Acp29AB-like [Drosophila navojoa]|uniref:accessory gland protein Acp29AB-like n=1 Tax=Drosophila navojoa TaxID=7232 RepID=UPI0011BF83A0|nr:accessory gland protein Acp29AB-like [Drosophila navojoa]
MINLMEGTNTRALIEGGISNNFEEKIPEPFEKVGEKYYYFENKETQNWFGAVEKCRQIDGHLINLQNENELVNVAPKLSSSQEYWTDINNLHKRNIFFSLTTGREANMLNNRSDNKVNRCGLIQYDPSNSNFNVTKRNCFQKKNFICETTQPTTISILLW